MKIPYRLGLDIGTNSIGWCVFHLNESDEPIGIVRAGSRIFSDGRNPKDLASLAASRRAARQARRRHDRVLKRQTRFVQGLIQFGLMPVDDEKRLSLSQLDPYILRAKGLDEVLQPFELGRALYHLAKRRGFKSSRKDQSADEKETGKINSAIANTMRQIEENNCRTFGEYLAKRHSEGKTTRARLDGKKDYILYSQRQLVADEFDLLWETQQKHHPELLTGSAKDYLRNTLLFQRPLLPVELGRCIFEPDQYRIPQCSPLQQQFRVLQELNNLKIQDSADWRPLTLEERNILRDKLYISEKISFADIRKTIGFAKTVKLNLEEGKKSQAKSREFLKGDVVSAKFLADDVFSSSWKAMSAIQQEALAVLVDVAADNETLKSALAKLPNNSDALDLLLRDGDKSRVHYKGALKSIALRLSDAQIEAISRIKGLPDDHGSLSRKALERIVTALNSELITYDKAVLKAGYQSHSSFYTGEIHSRLPYYGQILSGYTSPTPKAANDDERRYGKLPNPTVHIGLNQLRLIVNEIMRRWGSPREIIVELAREFGMSGKNRNELISEQEKNRKKNEELNTRLRELGQRENRENRQRLQLYEEMGKHDAMFHPCIYSGAQIGIEKLFSSEVEIDHILPFSRSLDDSLSNKVLCLSRANRDKKNRTPYEAFAHSPGNYSWESILVRAENLPSRKAKRFNGNAMQEFLERSKLSPTDLQAWGFDSTNAFLARQLTDTAYLSRVARQYLVSVCPPNKVWSATGRLTAQLRGSWGLNDLLNPSDSSKNRDDHRHHALDAAVIAACDRSTIHKMAQAAARAEETGENRLVKKLPPPWPTFRDELGQVLAKIIVSHKLDHGPEAGLHNDTNYGKRGEADKRGALLVSHRVPLDSIKDAKDAEKIADSFLREEIIGLLKNISVPKDIKIALDEYSQRTGMRRVHILERLSVIPIHDRLTHQPYRYVKGDGNYCYEIYRNEGKWQGEVINIYEANQDKEQLKSKAARNCKSLVMRIRKGDILKLEHDGRMKIMRVAKFSNGRIMLSEHCEANVDARDRDKNIDFQYMQKSPNTLKQHASRIIGVDILGYVNDPGFKE